MKPLAYRTLPALFGCLLAASASAQETAPFDPSPSWAFGGAIEQVNFDKQQAAREFIDDSATAIRFEAEYFFHRLFSTSVGMSIYFYDDNGTFNQWTEDWDGDPTYASSDAFGFPIYGEAGYKQFFGADGRTYLTLRGGLSLMLSSERSISDCSDCYEEDIDIEGGFYGVAGAGVKLGRAFLLGVHYQYFFNGDIDDAAGLSLSYALF